MREHRDLTDERKRAERRAEDVHRGLIEPLRVMRHYDALTSAIQNEIRRQAAGEGGDG